MGACAQGEDQAGRPHDAKLPRHRPGGAPGQKGADDDDHETAADRQWHAEIAKAASRIVDRRASVDVDARHALPQLIKRRIAPVQPPGIGVAEALRREQAGTVIDDGVADQRRMLLTTRATSRG